MPLIAHLLGHPAVCLKHLLQLQCSPTPTVGSALRFVGLRWRVKLAMFDPDGRVPKAWLVMRGMSRLVMSTLQQTHERHQRAMLRETLQWVRVNKSLTYLPFTVILGK